MIARMLAAACLLAVSINSGAAPPSSTPGAERAPDLAALAKQIPGFGGLFLEDGVPTVYLTDVGQRGAAEAALAGYARAQGVQPWEIRVRRGEFRYEELDGWFRGVSHEAFEIPGVVFVDLDEASNRVGVGVEHAGAGASVRGLAARLGVPADALDVREVEPIHQLVTLRQRVNARIGGIQIHFGQYLCTLGFNAVRGTEDSFVTNSHCTNKQGGTEGTRYYQPTSTVDPVSIGVEVHDPEYFRGGVVCPKGRRCRWSDSSRARYASGTEFTLGQIARPNGSLDITGEFAIANKGTAVVGEWANKVGRTTGWTRGQVTGTCVHTGVSGTNIVQLCQTFVSAGVGSGDSGSPVFTDPSNSNVLLLGILWGGNFSGTQFVYSPMSGIERELGTLTVR